MWSRRGSWASAAPCALAVSRPLISPQPVLARILRGKQMSKLLVVLLQASPHRLPVPNSKLYAEKLPCRRAEGRSKLPPRPGTGRCLSRFHTPASERVPSCNGGSLRSCSAHGPQTPETTATLERSMRPLQFRLHLSVSSIRSQWDACSDRRCCLWAISLPFDCIPVADALPLYKRALLSPLHHGFLLWQCRLSLHSGIVLPLRSPPSDFQMVSACDAVYSARAYNIPPRRIHADSGSAALWRFLLVPLEHSSSRLRKDTDS